VESTVRPRLLSVAGVAQVIPIGGEVRQLRVSPKPAVMRALQITPEQIETSVRRFGTNVGGGYVDKGGSEFLIRGLAQSQQVQDLAATPVDIRQGQVIPLRQVADVSYEARPKRGDAGFNGNPSVIISIAKQPGIDTLTLTRELEGTLSELQRAAPSGVNIHQVLFRQATFIETALFNVSRAFVEAVVVVALILMLFLRNRRATLISLIAIPLSVLMSVLVFRLMGLGVNTMTLGGLAIAVGELVDDAVVDVENILRRLHENDQATPALSSSQVIINASQEVRSSVVMATLIIVLVLLPVFSLSGIEGRLFMPLGIAYVVSILASLLVAVTVTPALASWLLADPRHRMEKPSSLMRRLEDKAGALMEWAFSHARLVFLSIGALFILALTIALWMPRAFLPPFNEGSLTINLTAQPGLSLHESNRLGQIAEKIILSIPDVKSVGRRTGRAEMDEHAEGVHSSEIDVGLKKQARPVKDVAVDIRQKLAALPININVGQPISHRIDHLMAGVRAEMALKVMGPDLDTLRLLADQFRQKMVSVSELADVQVERQTRIPQIKLDIDYQQAALYGLRVSDVVEAVEGLANGRVVSQLLDGNRRIEVAVRLNDGDRSATSLGNLLLKSPSGMVPLRQVARVLETDGPNQVLRDNGMRRIAIIANSQRGADLSRVAQRIEQIIATTPLPAGYSATLEGTFQAQASASRLILGLSLVSLALISFLLYARYSSARLVLIVLMSIPLAFMGGVLALMIAGETLSVASLVGFITLAGITARNAILKTSHVMNLAVVQRFEMSRALVIEGSLERLRPVLMTSLSACVGLFPLVLASQSPGMEILHPVAVTIFGGLIVATMLDTVMTPLLIWHLGREPIERLQKDVRLPTSSPVLSPFPSSGGQHDMAY
jgi:heavy-metal exporter, HME family